VHFGIFFVFGQPFIPQSVSTLDTWSQEH